MDSTESMEAFVIEVEAKVSAVLDARLKTIDARLARIERFVTLCETLAAQLQESPMFQMMSAGDGIGFPNFGS